MSSFIYFFTKSTDVGRFSNFRNSYWWAPNPKIYSEFALSSCHPSAKLGSIGPGNNYRKLLLLFISRDPTVHQYIHWPCNVSHSS